MCFTLVMFLLGFSLNVCSAVFIAEIFLIKIFVGFGWNCCGCHCCFVLMVVHVVFLFLNECSDDADHYVECMACVLFLDLDVVAVVMFFL